MGLKATRRLVERADTCQHCGMSSSLPSDLAVTFRSIPRRLKEAQGDTPAAQTQSYTSTILRLLTTAAGLLHTNSDPASVAAAIEAVPADDWDPATLDQLRETALELGGALRSIAAANPDND
jgi:hypothetical protein